MKRSRRKSFLSHFVKLALFALTITVHFSVEAAAVQPGDATELTRQLNTAISQ